MISSPTADTAPFWVITDGRSYWAGRNTLTTELSEAKRFETREAAVRLARRYVIFEVDPTFHPVEHGAPFRDLGPVELLWEQHAKETLRGLAFQDELDADRRAFYAGAASVLHLLGASPTSPISQEVADYFNGGGS